ncbi:MAG: phosphoglucosamine mutase [Planctomycetes bacterium GWF2_41_51]|nr:MAG: phosphoglucosamine mutase [Planctomycetes bacterium GWF2_41_51]HBG26377.1 phosphoglucosamine mutase [Phycisphaerales bacterium]
MQDLIISISGLRGIVGENFNASVALRYACAFATFLKNSKGKKKLKIAVGTDSRPSGDMLKSAVMAGLSSLGAEVIDVGLVTTPTVGIMVTELLCDGGLVITASHNPIEYNGIKLLTSKGIAPPPGMAEKVKALYEAEEFTSVSSVECGRITVDHSGDSNHLKRVLDCVKRNQIAPCRFRVVLDSVNGAGGRPTKRLLSIYGCRITALNDKPTGMFAHTPEPREENLTSLCDAVKKLGADIGFAQDPDADRLAIVDENGRYIGEEYTLALAAKNILSHQKGTVVTNLSTSRMIDDIAKEAGCEVIRTPVGEANVAQTMIKNNSPIGGEGNGGVIDLRVGPIRDSLIGIALILQLCAETGKRISELVEEIPAYEMIKEKFNAEKKQAEKIFTQAKKTFKKAEINESDGCRFDFEDGWIHLRTSNTEPVIRLISEFRKDADSSKYLDKIKAIIEKATG